MDFSQLEWVLWRKRSRWEIRVLEKKTLDSFPLAHTVPFILYSSFSHPLTMGLQKGWKIGYSLLKWVIWHPLNKAVNTNSRVHGHQQDGLFECRFGDPCGLTAMLPPGLSSLTLQSQFLENGYPPPAARRQASIMLSLLQQNISDLVLCWVQIEGKEGNGQLWKDQFVSDPFFLTIQRLAPHLGYFCQG